MALVMQPTMNLNSSASTAATVTSPSGLKHPQHMVCHLSSVEPGTDSTQAEQADACSKKRPLSVVTNSINTSNKRPRTSLTNNKKSQKRVKFVPDALDPARVHTQVRTFAIDYDSPNIWWTPEEARAQMNRQHSLLHFYANTCPDLVDSVLLVWVHCAEEALADGNYCMTPAQRSQMALKVAQSPVRGFEKELASALITEQRNKTIGGLLELQQLCRVNAVPQGEQGEALAAASEAFSQASTIFARAIAQADAEVASQHCASSEST